MTMLAKPLDPAVAVPLSMVTSGQTVELVEIRSGQRLRKRLAELGLHIGTPLRVVQGTLRGPVILAVKGDCRLALGRGITQRIIVMPQAPVDA
jgi:ferrous iron transport protein A